MRKRIRSATVLHVINTGAPGGHKCPTSPTTAHVVIAEADPDASILATIRKSLDVSDPNEADEMARRVLAGLRAAGLVSRS